MAKKHTGHTDTTLEAAAETVTGVEESSETLTAPETVETMAAAETVTTTETTETVMETVAEAAPQTALECTAEPESTLSEAIREGSEDARATAANLFPALSGLLYKGVYNSFYVLTYGVVFGSLVVGSLIPSNNAMGDGVRAGFKAAQKDFKAGKEATGAPSTEGLAAA